MITSLPPLRVRKRFALLGGALLALSAGGGVAAAQSQSQSAGAAVACGPALARPVAGTAALSLSAADVEARQQKYHQVLAGKLGISVERLTQATAEARTEAGLPETVTFAAGAPGAPGLLGVSGRVFTLEGGDPLAAAARALNLPLEQLREELKSRSLTDLARAKGVEPAAVAAALKNDERARIDAAVAKGGLPAEAAETLRAGIDARVEQLLGLRFAAAGDVAFACGGAAVVAPANR